MNALIRTSIGAVLCVGATSAAAICDNELGPVAGLFAVGLADTQGTGPVACLAIANHSTDNLSPRETLLFDGETTRLDLGWRWRGTRWEAGIRVPWLRHDEGFLDNTIEGWHNLFGLPNGNRDRRPDDALAFRWSRDNVTLLDRTGAVSGLGDVRLSLGRELTAGNDWSLGARAVVKLPTGDADDLTGSGATDTTVGLAFAHHRLAGSERWRLTAAVSLTALGEADLAGVDTEDRAFAAHVAVRWQARRWLDVGARVRGRERLVVSDLREIGDSAVALDAWLGFDVFSDYRLTLGVSEDIQVDSQPDVVFRLGVTRRQGR